MRKKGSTERDRRTRVWTWLVLVACLGLSYWTGTPIRAEENDEIPVEGVDGAMLANVQAYVKLLNASEDQLEDRAMRRHLVEGAPEEVALALAPFGYYHATLEIFDAEDGGIERLVIDLGPPTLVSSLEIIFENAELEPELDQRLRGLLQLAVGDRLDHSVYEDGKRAIESALLGSGRLRAELVENEVLVDRGLNKASIRLRWNVGPEHFFGPLRFVNSPFGDDFMMRYVNIREGAPYTKRALNRLSKNIMDSPYFLSAEITPQMQEVAEDLRVPIRVRITSAKLNYFEIGVSAASDSGPGLEGIYERRWLNRMGHSFRTQLSPSTRLSFFTAAYTIPDRKRLDRAFSIGIDAIDETTDTNEKQNISYSLGHQRRWHKWVRTSSLRYLDEDWVAGGKPGTSALLLAQGTFSRKKPRHKMVPPLGWALSAGFKAASDSVLSDTSMIQVEMLGKYIHSFGESWRLLTRLNLGLTWVDDFDLLPASLRFYAGGDRSIRGYDFESLGPRNEEGLVTGGKDLAILSLEIEHSLSESLRLAAFLDYGNALSEWDQDLEAGAGIGARLATVIGMIRLDLAYPLTADDPKVRLHFTVGPDL